MRKCRQPFLTTFYPYHHCPNSGHHHCTPDLLQVPPISDPSFVPFQSTLYPTARIIFLKWNSDCFTAWLKTIAPYRPQGRANTPHSNCLFVLSLLDYKFHENGQFQIHSCVFLALKQCLHSGHANTC